MIGLIYLTFFALYFILGLGFSILFFRRSKRKHRWVVFIVFFLVYLPLPFSDLIVKTAILSARTFNSDLQEIRQTVEFPESVVWIDNVWPGFDEYGRHWMVKNYLDGVHLKILALHGDDGKFYLYRASAEDFAESEKLRPDHERLVREKKELEEEAKRTGRSGNQKKKDKLWHTIWEEHVPKIKAVGYDQQRKEEVGRIFSRPEIYQKVEDLPPVNYRVEFNPIAITSIEKKLLWADKIKVISTQSNNVIAYSKRYMSYGWWLGFPPGRSFSGGYQKGDIQPYKFDDKVLFEYVGVKNQFESVRAGLRRGSYLLSRLAWERKQKKQGGINNANEF